MASPADVLLRPTPTPSIILRCLAFGRQLRRLTHVTWSDGPLFLSDRQRIPRDGRITNLPIRSTDAPRHRREQTRMREGGLMTLDHVSEGFSEDMGERFDLLATDVKEYALFLVDPN